MAKSASNLLEEEIIMKKHKIYTMYAVLIVMALAALSACDRETVIMPDSDDNRIYVTGSATIITSPDIAIAQLGVQTFNKELEPAVDENNTRTDAIIATLRAQGVDEKDMKTSSFNIYPQREYRDNENIYEIVGYQVNNTLSVTLRDLDSVGKSLQMAITAGANNISGISFTLDDPEPVRNEARTKAIEDARQRAESMAEAAGVELGSVLNITETSSPGVIISRDASYDETAIKSDVPVQPGELELTVQVSMTFAINE
jgi:uncharacterized protein YggE